MRFPLVRVECCCSECSYRATKVVDPSMELPYVCNELQEDGEPCGMPLEWLFLGYVI